MQVTFGNQDVFDGEKLQVSLNDIQKTPLDFYFNGNKNINYTMLIRDIDAPNPDYLHHLVINAPGGDFNKGAVLIDYLPPQRAGHRYYIEVYKQTGLIDDEEVAQEGSLRGLSLRGRSFDIEEFRDDNNLNKAISSVVIETTEDDEINYGMNDKRSKDAKFERCVMAVKAKQPAACKASNYKGKACKQNAFAICHASLNKTKKK